MRSVVRALRYGSVLLTVSAHIVALGPATVTAQEGSSALRREEMSATLSAIVSYQPIGYDGTGGPYIDNSLGGTVPGLALGLEWWTARRPLLAVELSSTTPLKAVQSGRFIGGGGPAVARQRDTLVSMLSGARIPAGDGAVDVKGGLTVLFGKPQRVDLYDNDLGHLAFTAGLDGVIRVGPRVDLVPSVRYSRVVRGDNALYLGLGHHILRAGVGVRLR
jgi:hypothetical protein